MSEKQPTEQAVDVIELSKDDYITSEDDHKEGMERTIPLDKLGSIVSLELAASIEKDGKSVDRIEIHPPTTADVKKWRSSPNPAASIDIFIVKCLRRWSPADLDSLAPYDYLRVQKTVLQFL